MIRPIPECQNKIYLQFHIIKYNIILQNKSQIRYVFLLPPIFHCRLSSCIEFAQTVKLPAHIEFIFVKCKLLGKVIYKNTHAIIREKPHLRQRLDALKAKPDRALSVLMLSIDSISRLNLIRAMPKTAQHLYDTGWFELQGYNKVCKHSSIRLVQF